MAGHKLPTLINTKIGNYRVKSELARGGMGIVYEAEHEAIAHRAAIKLLIPDLSQDTRAEEHLQRFRDEAKAVNIINHPDIVRVFDFGQIDQKYPYIMMEYLEGVSLSKRLELEGGILRLGESVRIVRQIASALAVAHSKGIIHRDLKPGNIMLVKNPDGSDESVKIVDFGIAKFMDTPYLRTTVGIVMGTPAYMSPEQAQGRGEVSFPTDVYALGIILYRLLAGRVPFDGDPSAVMAMHTLSEPPPLREFAPSTPIEISDLVHRMISKAPDQRPTMRQISDYLQSYQLPKAEAMTVRMDSKHKLASSLASPQQGPALAPIRSRGRDVGFGILGGIVALIFRWLIAHIAS